MIVIYGQPPSKSNCYRIAYNRLVKSDKLKKYEKDFKTQIPKAKKTIEGKFKFVLNVHYESMRPDLDNVFKVILDLLQVCDYIKNDNKCMEIEAKKFIDKNNPRIEFKLIEL